MGQTHKTSHIPEHGPFSIQVFTRGPVSHALLFICLTSVCTAQAFPLFKGLESCSLFTMEGHLSLKFSSE